MAYLKYIFSGNAKQNIFFRRSDQLLILIYEKQVRPTSFSNLFLIVKQERFIDPMIPYVLIDR